MPLRDGTGPPGGGRRRSRRRRSGPQAVGAGGQCVCPKCGHRVRHTVGQPCGELLCPKCKAVMTRE